jgi:hypothetical protein
MARASCSCGALALEVPAQSPLVVACHCLECQRRTGSLFGVGAYFPTDAVTIEGEAREYRRSGTSGGQLRNYFCPTCGSTVYWQAEKLPGMIAVAVGALAEPAHRAPDRSVFERSKHHWVAIDAAAAHFPQGSGGAPAK